MRTHRVLRVAAVAVTLAATSPAVAVAGQDLRSPDARDAAAAAAGPQDLRTPDARDAARTVVSASPGSDLRSPDARDVAAGRATGDAPAVVVVPVPHEVAAADGMDWADAGIGAGGILVLLAAGLAGALSIGRRRHVVVLGRRAGSVG
jgi:hypothetical protein